MKRLRRRVRLIALLVFRDEMRWLPGWFENVPPHVDGVVALDDGSSDGSTEFVEAQASVVRFEQRPRRAERVWHEGENRRGILEVAMAFHPCWFIVVDADERLEEHFGERAVAEIRRARKEQITAYSVILRDVWDRPDAYRVDGSWGDKRVARLFASRRGLLTEGREHHVIWPSDDSRRNGQFPRADLILYHLRMLHRADREARHARWCSIDPDLRWQPSGYDHMVDESGLRLESLPQGRGYAPLGR